MEISYDWDRRVFFTTFRDEQHAKNLFMALMFANLDVEQELVRIAWDDVFFSWKKI